MYDIFENDLCPLLYTYEAFEWKAFSKQIGNVWSDASVSAWLLEEYAQDLGHKNLSEAVNVTLNISIKKPTLYTFSLKLKEHSKQNILCNIFPVLWVCKP